MRRRQSRRYIFNNFIRVVNLCHNRCFFHNNLSVAHFTHGFLNFFLLRGEIWSVAVVFGSSRFRRLFWNGMFVFVLFVFLMFFGLVALVWAVLFVLMFVLFLVFFLGWSVRFFLVIGNSSWTVAFRRSKVKFGYGKRNFNV